MRCGGRWEMQLIVQAFDYLSPPKQGRLFAPALYCGGDDAYARLKTDAYTSPLFADAKNLPPLLIQAGEAECLRDDSTLFAHRAAKAGVDVTYGLLTLASPC